MASILVVASGNVCRSPTRGQACCAPPRCLDLSEAAPHVRSAGTAAWRARARCPSRSKRPPAASTSAATWPATVSRTEAEEADLATGMAAEHREEVSESRAISRRPYVHAEGARVAARGAAGFPAGAAGARGHRVARRRHAAQRTRAIHTTRTWAGSPRPARGAPSHRVGSSEGTTDREPACRRRAGPFGRRALGGLMHRAGEPHHCGLPQGRT